jgi:hypothetical protein
MPAKIIAPLSVRVFEAVRHSMCTATEELSVNSNPRQ